MPATNPKRELLPIPANLTPDEFVCFCFKLPRDTQHLGAFWGAVGALAQRYSWGKPLSADSETVAAYWQALIRENQQSFDEEIDMAGCSQPCCPDPITRVDENGVAQTSFDNGATYVPDASDVRMGVIPLPPLPGPDGDDKKCRAATALAEGYKSATDQLINTANAWITVGGLIEAVTLILTAIFGFAAPIAVAIVSAVAFALFLIGSAALAAAMTTQVYHDLECIFFCRVGDDGKFTEAGWQAVKADIHGQFTGIAEFYLYNWTNALGPNGLNILTRILPVGAVDCSDCSCGSCRIEDVWQYNYETAQWFQPPQETENTVVLTSSTGPAREVITVAFGQPYPGGRCCNIVAWEQISGNQIFIVDQWDCADQQTSGGLPSGGCWKQVTIYSQLNPEPRQVWRMTLGDECV